MEKIWRKHWPSSVDEASIRFSGETLPTLLAGQARRVPDRAALIYYGREVTFRELDAAVSRFAGWLRRRGIQPGDRVAIFLENSPQFAIAYYGALRAGAIAVCLNPMHKAVELLHEFKDSGARALVTSSPGYTVVEPIRQLPNHRDSLRWRRHRRVRVAVVDREPPLQRSRLLAHLLHNHWV